MAKTRTRPSRRRLNTTLAIRRRRLSKLRKQNESLPHKPSPRQSQEGKPKVEILYFPSASCDALRVPLVPASPNQDDTFFQNQSPNNGPNSITLFSLSPKSSSPCKQPHSQLLNELGENTSTCHKTISPNLKVAHNSYSPLKAVSSDQQSSLRETVIDHVKREPLEDYHAPISHVVTGRRVVNLGLVLEKYEAIAIHPLQCPKGRMVALSEEFNDLRSTIRFMCYECGEETALESDLYLVF